MAQLILVPTPLQEDLPLEPVALDFLQKNWDQPDFHLLMEEHKVARQRWLKWGLPREAIDKFVLYNEHTREEKLPEILQLLKKGDRFALMSDGGLPAFCDPGVELVDTCHEYHFKVTSTPFANSVALAVALSGFEYQPFTFFGFPPQKDPEMRIQFFKNIWTVPHMCILMDTPYRLDRVCDELKAQMPKNQTNRLLCLVLELSGNNEVIVRSTVEEMSQKIRSLPKSEFVLVLGPKPI